jgi:predicted component of type VI protein secretion system
MMKSFSNACGVKDSLRLMIEGPGAKGAELRRFYQPFAVIGRDPRADVLLEDPQVSRRHVYLQVVGGWAFWVDLESRMGTRTEAGLEKSGWLTGGRFLGIGPYVIRRAAGYAQTDDDPPQDRPPRDPPLTALAYSREPLPDVALEFLNGPSQAMFWPMHRVMSLIGSATGCKFRLTDRSVSAFHASLLRTPAGLWVVDLRGGQSITVNAVPVRFHPLGDGDVLGIGRYRIRIRCRIRDREWGNESPEPVRAVLVRKMPRHDPAGDHHHALPAPDRAASAITAEPAADGPRAAPRSLPVPITPPASGMAIGTSQAPFPTELDRPGQSESVLVPLVNQFSLMQQQMFDQFQQAMGMLVQMFGTMHREQMDVIREELDRLHQLSEELQELKAELVNQSQGSAEPLGERTGAAAGLNRHATTAANASAVAAASVRSGSTRPSTTPPGVSASADSPSAPSPLLTPCRDQPQPGIDSQGGPSASAVASDRDALLWLHERIATLQQERESRWQKILKLLPGVS